MVGHIRWPVVPNARFISYVGGKRGFSGLRDLFFISRNLSEKPENPATTYFGLMADGENDSPHIEAVRETLSGAASLQKRVVALYEAHRDGIYRFLVGHGLTPGEAQEVTQDVFVDLLV